jgi:DNA repair exonuclease SbcCD ATPase subunit
MAIEFRNGFFGFNKTDVLNYVHQKDKEFKELAADKNNKISVLEAELEALRSEHNNALAVIGSITAEKDALKAKVEEYDKKSREIDDMSTKIGKLYLVSKSSAKGIVSRAEQSSDMVTCETDKSLENLEVTQSSLKEIAEDILAASQSFVEKLDALQDSLTATKIKVSENKAASNVISDEFADLYAKLG